MLQGFPTSSACFWLRVLRALRVEISRFQPPNENHRHHRGVRRIAGSIGNKALRAFRARGYTVIPINPNETRVEGEPAFPTVLDYPETIDEATVYVTPDVGLTVIEQMAKKGIKTVWLNPGADDGRIAARAEAAGRRADFTVLDCRHRRIPGELLGDCAILLAFVHSSRPAVSRKAASVPSSTALPNRKNLSRSNPLWQIIRNAPQGGSLSNRPSLTRRRNTTPDAAATPADVQAPLSSPSPTDRTAKTPLVSRRPRPSTSTI